MIIQLGLSVYDNKVPIQTFRRTHHGNLSTGCRVGSGKPRAARKLFSVDNLILVYSQNIILCIPRKVRYLLPGVSLKREIAV